MKSILTTEQFMQWSQMRMPGQRGHGPQAMHKGKDGKKQGECKANCDKPCPVRDKKGKK